jgi:predicted permease
VLGVMPREFAFYPAVAALWNLMGPEFQPPRERMIVGTFARLKPGVSIAQAQAEIAAAHRAMHAGDEWRDFEPVVYDLHSEFTFLASRTLRSTLALVFAAVLLVLWIACLNVANLLLARISDRQRELGVRAALGSGQARLVRQVLTEGLVLSSFGTAAGILVAWALTAFFRSASPIELPPGATVSIGLPVLLFAALLGAVTTLIFCMLPALRASRVDISQRLKAAGRGRIHGSAGYALSRILIAAETGMSFVLLTGAGLLMSSVLRFGSENLGFDPQGLVATSVPLRGPSYADAAQRAEFCRRLLDRVSTLPGVSIAALSSRTPPASGGVQALEIQGRPTPDLPLHDVGADSISPAYFSTLGIPLRQGREFDVRDVSGAPAVAIVNESLVREYFPGVNPLGRQIRTIDRADSRASWLTIVGVVGNVKHTVLMNEMTWVTSPMLYESIAQNPAQPVSVIVRPVPSAIGAIQPRLQSEIASLDPSIPRADLESIQTGIARNLVYPRFRASLLSFFAVMALVISAVGVHGVLTQLVAQRTSEFGLRRAVGASTANLLFLIARQGGLPVAAGLVAGIAATIAIGRLISGLLYGVHPVEPATILTVSAILLAVACIAMALPARRAAQVDPMAALREE